MVSSWMEKLAGKGRRGGNAVLVQISREVVGRRRSIAGAVSEVRHPAVLDALSDDDFKVLDQMVDERITSDREFATVLSRLTHAAAHAKGFDRQTVDAALRLDTLLPAEDPGREREKLLRDAYRAAQRAGYVQGGRKALARLGQRAVAAGDGERARVLLQQQVDLGPEQMDTEDEVDSAILLGDILRRDGDGQGAMDLFERSVRSSERIGYLQRIAEASVRVIDIRRATLDQQSLADLQWKALDAARQSGDSAIQSRLIANYAETLVQLGRLDEAAEQLESGLAISREIGDLSLENYCLEALSTVERELGRMQEVVDHEAELVAVEERRGHQPAAAHDAVQHGATLLSLGRLDAARSAYQHAVELARSVGDELLEQRAYGGLGVTYSQSNLPVEALNHLMLALDLARANNDAAHEAQWLASIGEALWKFDQPEDAVKAIQQAIVAARNADDAALEAGMLSLLGQIHVSSREPDKARLYYTHALDIYRELGEAESEIQTLSAIGALAMDADQPAEAIRMYDDALQLAARTDQRAAAVRIYGRLARLSQREGDDEAALEALEQAASLADSIPDQRALFGQALQHLAVAQDAAGLPVAMNTYEEALDIAREVGDIYGEALMLVNVGARLISLGAHADGATILEHAIRLTEDLGAIGMKLRQRAEGMLVPIRTQARSEGARRVPPTRDRAPAPRREGRSFSSHNATMAVPSAPAIPVAPNEMYSRAVSFNR